MTRYLKQLSTGRVYIATPQLEALGVLVPMSPAEVDEFKGGKSPPSHDAETVNEDGEVGGHPAADLEPDEASTDGTEKRDGAEDDLAGLKSQIEGATTKEEVEAIALKAFGVDIDRRKSLATLKAELVEKL